MCMCVYMIFKPVEIGADPLLLAAANYSHQVMVYVNTYIHTYIQSQTRVHTYMHTYTHTGRTCTIDSKKTHSCIQYGHGFYSFKIIPTKHSKPNSDIHAYIHTHTYIHTYRMDTACTPTIHSKRDSDTSTMMPVLKTKKVGL